MGFSNPFFLTGKQGKNYYSVQGYKDHIISQLQWLPTALRIKSKILHMATGCSCLSSPDHPGSFSLESPCTYCSQVCLQPLPLPFLQLMQTHAPGFHSVYTSPGVSVFPSWARILVRAPEKGGMLICCPSGWGKVAHLPGQFPFVPRGLEKPP